MDDEPDDLSPSSFGRPSSPGVRFSRGEEDRGAVSLWYGTFDVVLRALHDLWWVDRRINRLRLLGDWVADRGLFDDESGRSRIDDPEATLDALRLSRDRLARRATDQNDEVDAALVALIRFFEEAIAHDLPIDADRV